jgi:hypothetical protein
VQIDSLEQVISIFGDRLDEVESIISQCCYSDNKAMKNPEHSTSITLENRQTVVLNQNVPNPFAENTTISYFVPEDAGSAQMLFTDPNGKIIKTIELTSRGEGMIQIFANDLSSGVYTYSIIIDGALIETKKMIKKK